MTTSRRLATLPLLLLFIGLAALAAGLVVIPWVVQAQSQEVTPTQAATGSNPPAKPTNLLASAEHDSVTLTWTASTDQTVTHYAVLRRNPGTDASQVFHVIESNAGPETSYSDGTVSASTTYIYRVKSVSPTGVSQWSGYVKAETPAAPDSTLEPTPTPTATPTPEPVSTPTPEDLRPTGLTVSLVENKVTLSWSAPAEDAESVDGYEILRRRPMEGESTPATLVADTESTATTYIDATANEAGVRYVYRVKALRGDDVSLSSNFDRIDLPADYAPNPTPTPEPESTPDDQAPTGLSAALADGGGVALSWSAPSEDAESVTGYEILRAVGEGEMATLAADTASTTTSYTDATATEAGETYTYQVKAIRGEDRSEASDQAQVQLPHDPVDLAPTGLTAVVLTASVVGVGEDSTATASTSVSLSWSAPAEDADTVTGYEILRAVGEGDMATLVDDTGSIATSYTDATATEAGETYAYKVKAIRGENRSQASGQARIQLPHDAVDLAPSDLTAAAVDGGGVDLSWSAPAEDADSVTGYEVLRAVGEGEMATLAADTASTATTYTDATATGEGETYAYRVKAIRGEARSQASNRVALVPVEPPATPENLKPTNLTFEIREDGVTLAWDAPAADADSVTGYRVVRRRPDQGENQWLVWKWDTGSTETSYRDGYARTHGDYYMYRVRALRGDDYSKMSNRVDVRRPQATPQTAEWAPSNLKALVSGSNTIDEHGNIQVGDDTVQLSWDAPAEDVEWVRGYEVQRATCDGDFAALAADTGSTATAHADATAEAGESYTYRVRARRPQGLSLTSNTWTLLVPGGPGESECAVPTFLLSQVQDPQTGLTPATLESTLLGYDEAEGAGTLAPNELIFGEDGAFRVTSVNAWPGNPGLVLYLTAGSSAQDAALADRDFILEADETVLVVGETEFSFDDATLSHSDTTGDNAEYTGVVIATWTEGQAGLVAGETVDFRLLLRNRPDEAQFTQHDSPLVKNTGQITTTFLTPLTSDNPKRAVQITTGADSYELSSIGVYFKRIDNTGTAGSHLTVTLNAVASGEPGAALCTLTDPSTFSTGVLAFDAPATCPELEASTSYFVVIERVTHTTDVISVGTTVSNNEDTGGAAGWLIGNSGYRFSLSSSTWNTFSDVLQIEVRGNISQGSVVRASNTGQTADGSSVSLTSNRPRLGQQFLTGASPAGYKLGSISFDFSTIGNTATAGSELEVKLFNEAVLVGPGGVHPGIPGGVICTLSDPQSFSASGVHTFDAPQTCPKLQPGTVYFAVIQRSAFNGGTISLTVTTDSGEDAGGAAGWSIGNHRNWYLPEEAGDDTGFGWRKVSSESHLIEVSAAAEVFGAEDTVTKHFNSLYASGNEHPRGIWSDGDTMWVADLDGNIYAYDMDTKAPKPAEFFTNLAGANSKPRGIWSDGDTMWVSDWEPTRVFAYDMDTKARVRDKEFPVPAKVSGTGIEETARFHGIWSDGSGVMWMVSLRDRSVYAFDMATGDPVPSEQFIDSRPTFQAIEGLWGDDQSLWLTDAGSTPSTVKSVWRYNNARQPGRDIQLDLGGNSGDQLDFTGNANPVGLWSDGATMWVADSLDARIYAYPVPDRQVRPRDLVSVKNVSDTRALVEVDIARLVRSFGSAEPAVSVHVVDTLSSATMYVHPKGGYARFLLMGLRPETPYTVVVTYGVRTKYSLGTSGRKFFRTKPAQLDGIAISGLNHTEATVQVLLSDAALQRGCCFRFYPHSNRDEAGPDYTFYLRHKASGETEWAASVQLTFSDFVADARLTGLDPGTAYDVEVAESPTFMPEPASVASYTGTLTVGDDGFISGYDAGFNVGSLSPDPTIENVGIGVDRFVSGLFINPFGGESFDTPVLELLFDGGLAPGVEFTLTMGTTVYNSADSTDEGSGISSYTWRNVPSWSASDAVTVRIDFTATAEDFREGTHLEVEGAFTTHHMPPTLAYEAEMTVHVGSVLDGYHSGQGSISTNTFDVGGVQYTVSSVGFLKGSANEFQLTVTSALPFDSFTLTLGSTVLSSSSAIVTTVVNGTQTDYEWSGTNPNWANNDKVAVKLDIGLIDICDRSSAVAAAIKAATPSFDYCHMTSPLDLDDLTELRIPNGRGTGLKAGDFEGLSGLTRLDLSHYILSLQQLPVGVFNGLDSLTHLDLSHTDLLKLDLGVFDGLDSLVELDLSDTSLQRSSVPVGVFNDVPNLEVLRLSNESSIGGYRTTFSNLNDDFFRGLAGLRELDLGSSNPLRDSPRSLMPLTSLTTLNGQAYTRPADPPANFQYASGRIDHELGYHRTCYAVTLKWDRPTGVSGITGYRVLRNLGSESLNRYARQIATTGASARTFVDGRNADVCFGGVGSGPNVSYFVSAITGDGDSFPARVRVDQTAKAFPTTQVPNTPTLRESLYDLSVAKSPNGYKVRLQWNDLHHNITGYEISFRGSSAAAWRTIVANAGNVLEYDLESVPILPSSVPRTAENMFLYQAFRDQGVSLGFTDGREFRIRALNAAGNSGWSNVVRPFR